MVNKLVSQIFNIANSIFTWVSYSCGHMNAVKVINIKSYAGEII